jgi:hypothetical protein
MALLLYLKVRATCTAKLAIVTKNDGDVKDTVASLV